jgi:hypothetical protein
VKRCRKARGSTKPYVLGLICVLAVLTAFFIFFNSSQPQETIEHPVRESVIPVNAMKMTPETDFYPPILYSDEWMQPVPLSEAINTAGGEDSAFVMPDGNTLFFFFTPDVSIPAEEQVADGVTGIYVSRRQNGAWSEAERLILQEAGKLALDGAQFVQGNTMWFASAREGYTGVNYFTAELKDGKWTNWQYVGDKLMKDYRMGEMHISADDGTLYFHSDRSGGKGGLDIWASQKVDGEWQTPENVAVVNTEGNEGWPFLTQDGNELWFTRTYLGSPAIFRSLKVHGEWQEPELILSQFAGESSIENNGNIYFTHHFYNNESQMIEADIYVALKK